MGHHQVAQAAHQLFGQLAGIDTFLQRRVEQREGLRGIALDHRLQ